MPRLLGGGAAAARGAASLLVEGGARTLRGLADLARLDRAHAHDALVDGGLDAVELLDVDLRELVPLDARGVLDITERRRLDDVADDKALDRLVLGMAFPVDTQRTRLTWPRPFLLRPCDRRLTVMV